jgi:hypothetical protein
MQMDSDQCFVFIWYTMLVDRGWSGPDCRLAPYDRDPEAQPGPSYRI